MSWILLGNDDGTDSPALVPFANALERALDMAVRICVPAVERSWGGKAITRLEPFSARHVTRDGRSVVAVDGTPADAIQLGMYGMFAREFLAAPPQAVVTGINLGFNHGTGFMASSGTVWAALEAGMAGIPAVAVSTGERDYHRWRAMAESGSAEADTGWDRLAEVAADVVLRIGATDLADHCDAVSVNMPWEATLATPRRLTTLSPLAYGPLFDPTDTPGEYQFTNKLKVRVDREAAGPDGDVLSIADEVISVTPIVLPASPTIPRTTRAAIEA